MTPVRAEPTCWQDAVAAAALAMNDPAGCGGLAVKARAGPVLDRYLAVLRELAGARAIVKLPPGVTDDRLIGGLDLGRTLELGRPVLEPGLLAKADGGILLVPGAERLSTATAARIAAALDRRSIVVEREGLAGTLPASFLLVLLDESSEPDEAPPEALLDRVAFRVDLDRMSYRDAGGDIAGVADIAAAAQRLGSIPLDTAAIEVMAEAADALGVASQRAAFLALRAARSAAALAGRAVIGEDELVQATRLVLAPRATTMPSQDSSVPETDEQNDGTQPDGTPPPQSADGSDDAAPVDPPSLDMLLAAARAVLPAGLLESNIERQRARSAAAGHAGRMFRSRNRGARMASRPGGLDGRSRLDIVATLRAAAPWQGMRRRESGVLGAGRAIHVRRQDVRVARYRQRSDTLTVFVVDASGSAALHRLAEAKGAVELLLADCYVRRDWVALVAFRGTEASLLLPPTRSLTRAKRCLGELGGGGGTPLAAGMRSALEVTRSAERQGRTPTTVLLTDGRANVSLEGKPGRAAAEADAMSMARVLAANGERSVVIDTGQRPNAFCGKLAMTLGGRYVPLPYADAAAVNAVVREAL